MGVSKMDKNEMDIAEFARKFPKLATALGESSHYPLNVYLRFERILKQIESVWGTLAGHEYLETLLMTQRTDRQGFEDPVASELIRIHLLHIKQYPGRHGHPNDPFAQIV
jgi:hypothetical protein